MNWGYYLNGVDKEQLTQANNTLIDLANEIWVFGDISNGVFNEILSARRKKKNIRYFTVAKSPAEITEIAVDAVTFEPELLAEYPNAKNLIK